MGFLDKLKARPSDAVDKHGDKIADGIDKAADVADKKTGGKHTDKIDSGADKAKDALDKLDGKDDDIKCLTVPTLDEPAGATRPLRGRAGVVRLPAARRRGGTEVLLQLRQNTGYMDDHWAAAAAGHVERGETAFDAAHREAAEEIAVDDLDLEFVTAMQRTQHAEPIDERIDFFFTARSLVGRAADRRAGEVRRAALVPAGRAARSGGARTSCRC